MLNAKILDTFFGLAKDGDNFYMAMSLLIGIKDKQYAVGPITVTDMSAIAGILRVAEVPNWERVVGRPVQIEVTEDEVTKMANIINEDICLNFTKEAPAQDTSNQGENINE